MLTKRGELFPGNRPASPGQPAGERTSSARRAQAEPGLGALRGGEGVAEGREGRAGRSGSEPGARAPATAGRDAPAAPQGRGGGPVGGRAGWSEGEPSPPREGASRACRGRGP